MPLCLFPFVPVSYDSHQIVIFITSFKNLKDLICYFYAHLIDWCCEVVSSFSIVSQEDLWRVSLAMVRIFPVTG